MLQFRYFDRSLGDVTLSDIIPSVTTFIGLQGFVITRGDFVHLWNVRGRQCWIFVTAEIFFFGNRRK